MSNNINDIKKGNIGSIISYELTVYVFVWGRG